MVMSFAWWVAVEPLSWGPPDAVLCGDCEGSLPEGIFSTSWMTTPISASPHAHAGAGGVARRDLAI